MRRFDSSERTRVLRTRAFADGSGWMLCMGVCTLVYEDAVCETVFLFSGCFKALFWP